MVDNKIEVLNQSLSQIENYIPLMNKRDITISKSDVGWHLDHSLKVIHRVCNFLIASKQSDYRWAFNKWRFIIFLKGSIPRGKAKAPRHVRPPENISSGDLKTQLKEVKKMLNTIKKLPPKSHFDHHIFGKLHLKKAIRFLEIHTEHHIKIINDILNYQS